MACALVKSFGTGRQVADVQRHSASLNATWRHKLASDPALPPRCGVGEILPAHDRAASRVNRLEFDGLDLELRRFGLNDPDDDEVLLLVRRRDRSPLAQQQLVRVQPRPRLGNLVPRDGRSAAGVSGHVDAAEAPTAPCGPGCKCRSQSRKCKSSFVGSCCCAVAPSLRHPPRVSARSDHANHLACPAASTSVVPLGPMPMICTTASSSLAPSK